MSKDKAQDSLQLENTYMTLPSTFYHLQAPVPVKEASTVIFNDQLATQLGLNELSEEDITNYFSGNQTPKDSTTLAQAYAGHQFGHPNMLGDGRAILLGEWVDAQQNRWDVQLKGSGPTPYSRRGDGRATLYSMLREYLISEAMHHLNIPTTRSLAVVATGEDVYRETVQKGAVLTRIAASHIRCGTFEYARNFGESSDLEALMNYTIDRHYPGLKKAENPSLALLEKVMEQQINLVVNWMRVGFIHGVMNTDNMSIAGESIDYGPCAFMNGYDLNTVFSSIDTNGRYAFGQQPHIVHWNLTVFASALLPLISEDPEKAVSLAQASVNQYQKNFSAKWYEMMFHKIGIAEPQEGDKVLVDDLVKLLQDYRIDYTQFFVALQEERFDFSPLFKDEKFKTWLNKWKELFKDEASKQKAKELMQKTNPRVIPRNHWVENVLEAAVAGDMNPFNELLAILANPYDSQPDELTFVEIPAEYDNQYQTFCGT